MLENTWTRDREPCCIYFGTYNNEKGVREEAGLLSQKGSEEE